MSDVDLKEPLELWFGRIQVGIVNDAYYTDLNWYGAIDVRLDPKSDNLAMRVCSYINFSIDWHARLETEEPDADEFDAYNDVITTGQWYTRMADGTQTEIEPPVFWPGGELCWRVRGA